jgi:Glycosyl hydrolases family 39/Secretion system C-terminal sorting domain
MKKSLLYILLIVAAVQNASAQQLRINPFQVAGNVPVSYSASVNYSPKTNAGGMDFYNSGIHYDAVRIYNIETALNWSGANSIADVMTVLEAMRPGTITLSQHCNKIIMPILKMPLWLSSSNNTSPIPGAGDPSWNVHHGHPPANYAVWTELLDSVVQKMSVQWGLDIDYEIWNEPDNFYWQASPQQYFEFFHRSYTAIKTAHPNVRVGGPVVSQFTSIFGSIPPLGALSQAQLNQSIIANLIDSCVSWGTPLDFISWHKFDIVSHAIPQEMNFLRQKLISSGHGLVPLIVSEWNLTTQLRDTEYSSGYMAYYTILIQQYGASAQSVAAWQDFDSSSTEFHNDYGVVSWASLHKPAWKSMQLLSRLQGARIPVYYSDSTNLLAAASSHQDTLQVLISAYQLPPSAETNAYLLYSLNFNTNDLINEGLASEVYLDSIFRGLIQIPSTTPLTTAINQVIPYYQYSDSVFRNGRTVDLHLSGITGQHSGELIIVDTIQNNVVPVYDSLISAGYTRQAATAYLYPSRNNFSSTPILINDSVFTFQMRPNAVAYIRVHIPGITAVNNTTASAETIEIYPNPATDVLFINTSGTQSENENYLIYNAKGQCVKTVRRSGNSTVVNVADLAPGVYYVSSKNGALKSRSFIVR